jgi:HemY protein
MLRLIAFLIVAAVLAWVAVFFANHPGQVTLSLVEREFVFPIGIALAILAAFTAAAVILYEVWHWLVTQPRRIRAKNAENRRLRGYQELTYGLIAAAAGDVAGARVHNKQAEKLLDSSAATLLLSAQTAQLEGKEDVAQVKFQQMLKRPQTEFLGVRGLLADAVKRGDQQEALTLARRAYQRSPNTSWVLTTYFDLLTRNNEWSTALAIVDDLAREKLITAPEATRRRGLMKHMITLEALEAGKGKEALESGRKASGLVPAFAPAAVAAAEAARSLGKIRAARRLIEDCWALEPHPDLARAFADLVPEESAVERLTRCGRLAKQRPNHLISQMMMAELAMNARHWDNAKRHLDLALGLEPTAGLYRLYAEYERASGGGDAKARDWLAKAADAPPDKCWVCDDTGEVLATWQLFGPSGRFDSVHWDSPPKLAPMLRGEQRPAATLVHDKAEAAPSGNGNGAGKTIDGTAAPADDAAADGEARRGPQGPAGSTSAGMKAPPPIEAAIKTAGSTP